MLKRAPKFILTVSQHKRCCGIIASVVAAAVATGTDDEYDEVDDLEEMHMAIVNNDYDQVCATMALSRINPRSLHIYIDVTYSV